MKYIRTKFESIDKWICIFFPIVSIRLWWCRLWIRKNEFHPSLDIDMQILLSFKGNQKKKDSYTAELRRRRDVAHLRNSSKEIPLRYLIFPQEDLN